MGIVLYYQLNKAYISQKLCENRKNPNMHCNGKCYLGKQLKKAEEGEKKGASNILKEKDEIISDPKALNTVSYFPSLNSREFISYSYPQAISDYRNELIKPPTI